MLLRRLRVVNTGFYRISPPTNLRLVSAAAAAVVPGAEERVADEVTGLGQPFHPIDRRLQSLLPLVVDPVGLIRCSLSL